MKVLTRTCELEIILQQRARGGETSTMGTLRGGAVATARSVSAACRPAPSTVASQSSVERVKYLVTVGSCNDGHTHGKPVDKGPKLDMPRMLSGCSETMKFPPPPRSSSARPVRP